MARAGSLFTDGACRLHRHARPHDRSRRKAERAAVMQPFFCRTVDSSFCSSNMSHIDLYGILYYKQRTSNEQPAISEQLAG